MKIGVKNFRVFKDQTDFEIKPITILIGPNNSGKSSFTKLLMLLKSGYQNLNFYNKGTHNLESFEKCLNRDSNPKELGLNFSIKNDFLYNDEKSGLITYFEGGEIKSFSLFDTIISFETDEKDREVTNSTHSYKASVKIQEFIEFIIENLEAVLAKRNTSPHFDLFDKSRIDEVYEKTISKIDTFEIGHVYTVSLSEFYHRIKEFAAPYLLFDVLIDGNNVTNDYKDKIIAFQNDIFKNSNYFDFHYGGWYLDDKLIARILEPNELRSIIKQTLIEEFSELEIKNIEIENSKLADLLFKHEIYVTYLASNDEVLKKPIINLICESIFTDLDKLKNIQYLPALRGVQQRVYQKNDFAFNVLINSTKTHEIFDFLSSREDFYKEVCEIFNLEGEIKIEVFEDVLSVYLVTDKIKENLADKGLGFSQLIPLILFGFYDLHNTTLIIEEPEANLHPALQSKLADFFVCINKYFPDITLIIETHSEYLIRKLQFLVASKAVKSDQCIIHYFNAKDKIPQNEPQVKDIEIYEDGTLSDHFGSGFFDEVSLLQIQLMKYWKENQN